ncbi:hypothetical protein RKE30_29255 [Streptomyces sp. Li-HN-5-11]|uniref:hypothetical protein n=1 Tax=Streptomyces sp. Li-HN-5-11 TaxID=3075432 RepID=UPI0028AF58D8|nr:hypothetical protein [Streptomyces sp. Li-HN-5-11]WNM34169.1 hypothetical protein RKE30_29255 [Streptomyces sp. Li-HN-5-11]
MPTLTLPRALGPRVGAAAAFTALTAAGATWLAAPVAAAPGDAGDIKIHRVGVPFGVSKDDPVVCRFYLDAENFGDLTTIQYTIQAQPPLPTSATITGTIALGLNSGAGHTDPLGLADGQYRLMWTIGTTPKEKIFRVNCRDEDRHDGAQGPGSPIQDPGRGAEDPGRGNEDQHGQAAPGKGDHDDGPKGGVHAGGGGLARTADAFSPVTGAAAVGLVAVGGVVYLRLVRRRPHGAA